MQSSQFEMEISVNENSCHFDVAEISPIFTSEEVFALTIFLGCAFKKLFKDCKVSCKLSLIKEGEKKQILGVDFGETIWINGDIEVKTNNMFLISQFRVYSKTNTFELAVHFLCEAFQLAEINKNASAEKIVAVIKKFYRISTAEESASEIDNPALKNTLHLMLHGNNNIELKSI